MTNEQNPNNPALKSIDPGPLPEVKSNTSKDFNFADYLFSKRMKLAEECDQWIKDNNLEHSSFNVITYLTKRR